MKLNDGSKVTLAPGHILVLPDNSPKEVGGLAVLGTAKTKQGTVVSVGDRIFEMPEYPVGSTLHYLKTNGLDVELDGVMYAIVYFMDVKVCIEPC